MNNVTSAGRDDGNLIGFVARRKKRKKDKGVLAFFPPKRRKNVKALIRALGLVFVRAEKEKPHVRV